MSITWMLSTETFSRVNISPRRSRTDSMFAPSQWETALLCNDVSHWLSANLESALRSIADSKYLCRNFGFISHRCWANGLYSLGCAWPLIGKYTTHSSVFHVINVTLYICGVFAVKPLILRRTKSPNLNVSRLVLRLPLSSPLKPGVESRMKM